MKILNYLNDHSKERILNVESARIFFIKGNAPKIQANGMRCESIKVVVTANGIKKEFSGYDMAVMRDFYLALLQDLRADNVKATVSSYREDSFYRPTLLKTVTL